VMEYLDVEGKVESERLANERGAFPEWAKSIWGPDETCARDAEGKRIRPMQLLRNCNVTTVAPTGTISIIAGCSSGLEPIFAVAFMRNQAGVMMPDVNEDFVAIAKAEGWYTAELMERIAKSGHVKHAEVPAKWQKVFVTANVIAPVWHVRMQAAFQDHCDSAISKTTNFAHTATVEDVRAIYEMAYDMKCKGVTVYRDGSRDAQVLSTGATATAAAERDKPAASPSSIACVARCTRWSRRISSVVRSAPVLIVCARPRSGKRRHSARCSCTSPRTIAGSRSRCSSRSARRVAQRWRMRRRWGDSSRSHCGPASR
jgi:ribonucleoside-diphosphate reductase alpha chain